MASRWNRFLTESLQATAAVGRTRKRRALDMQGWIDFGSNDYLGLRSHPDVLSALQSASQGAVWGAGASPVLSGYSSQHALLEAALASFAASESALVFTSGFACHAGTVACLAGRGDLILSDQLNHASLIDGCRLSRATIHIYPHADVGFVRDMLRRDRAQYDKVLLLSESIFSMDGDAAPLAELVPLAQEFDAGLVVDEAHAVGVYGHRGSGLLEELQLQPHVLAKLGTLSKSLGCVGGYVAGPGDLIDYLVNHCRSYLFSTAAPSPALAAANRALQLLVDMPTERQKLRATARQLRIRLASLGLPHSSGDSPIVPIVLGSEQRVVAVSQQLWQAGLYVPAIRPPTVPVGTCRLRVSLSVQHTSQQIDRLVDELAANL